MIIQKNTKNRYDLVVIGGGPSGATAARFGSMAGLKTVILERKRDPGSPVRCAEGVSHKGLAYFVSPDSKWISSEITGARLYAPNMSFVEISNLGKGYILERKIFDRMLLEIAAQNGAEVKIETAATGLEIIEGRVSGVNCSTRKQNFKISCSIVIGADGIESRVGRWAGFKTHTSLKNIEPCMQYLLKGVKVDSFKSHFFFGRDIAPGGYAWIFPKGRDLANVGLGIAGVFNKKGLLTELLTKFISNHFPSAQPISFSVGGVPTDKTLNKIHGNGIMIVGDAARQVNPLSGGGIISGMMGGKLAAETAVKALNNGDVSEKVLKSYVKNWSKQYGNMHRIFYRLKEAVFNLSDEELNNTVKTLSSIPLGDLKLVHIFTHLLRHNPKLILELGKIFI